MITAASLRYRLKASTCEIKNTEAWVLGSGDLQGSAGRTFNRITGKVDHLASQQKFTTSEA